MTDSGVYKHSAILPLCFSVFAQIKITNSVWFSSHVFCLKLDLIVTRAELNFKLFWNIGKKFNAICVRLAGDF